MIIFITSQQSRNVFLLIFIYRMSSPNYLYQKMHFVCIQPEMSYAFQGTYLSIKIVYIAG